MEKSRIDMAYAGLKQLRHITKADLLTCYFLNPYSNLFWLFFTDGPFHYGALMHGPLTRPKQTERLLQIIEGKNVEGKNILDGGIAVFDPIPDILSQSDYEGDSFVKREGIERSIWITLKRENPLSIIEHSDNQLAIVIFLNYRDVWPKEPDTKISEILPLLKECLLPLVDQPCILEDEAWRLRNVSFQFYKKLEGMLVGNPDTPQLLYNFIVQQTFNLIKPEKGSNVLCTLALLDANNKPKVVACMPSLPDPSQIKTEGGIVDYVGHSGQVYLVSDIKAYEKEKSNLSCHPPFLRWDKKSRCELACPLIVQEKVIGVLNLEADEPNAYTKHHILMLLQFASMAGLVERQVALWQELYKCINAQSRIFQSDGIYSDDKEILNLAIEMAKSLGYETYIWDFETQDVDLWRGSNVERGRPREQGQGYTNWIKQYKCPIALADIRKDNSGSIILKTHKGILYPDTILFKEWQDIDAPFGPSDELKKEIESSPPVLTDLGFPIFNYIPLKNDSIPEVRAVLWAKCKRHFESVLYDDSWALSFLSRNTSMALGIRNQIYNNYGRVREELLKSHFGESRTGEILKNNISLEPKFATEDVYVLNLDIRGSTKIAAEMNRQRAAHLFVQFLEDYYRMVYKTTIKYDGVFDKTMGDGIQVLFNIYQPSLLNLVPKNNSCVVIKCAVEIFKEFIILLQKHRSSWPYQPVSGLGGGLSYGRAFVGSFSAKKISGLDYTVLGDTANNAGKLVPLARQEDIINWIERGMEWQPPFIPKDFNGSEMPEKDLEKLLTTLRDNEHTRCILLFDTPFCNDPTTLSDTQATFSSVVKDNGVQVSKIIDPNTRQTHFLLILS